MTGCGLGQRLAGVRCNPREVPHDYLGSHVHVRFEHSAEPVGWRLWRGMRRAFLSHFQV